MFSPDLRCGDRILSLLQTRVMGILNITPDSFCAQSRCSSPEIALEKAYAMVEAGAAIIDVGAEATQPKLAELRLSVEEELSRIVPVVKLLAKSLSIPISVDTSRPAVAKAVADVGAGLINDVRGLREPGMLTSIAEIKLPVCLMHMEYPYGLPENINSNSIGPTSIVAHVKNFLSERITACLDAGIAPENIIIDPGVGAGYFGKNTAENLSLLYHMQDFKNMGYPLLVGISRKMFIGDVCSKRLGFWRGDCSRVEGVYLNTGLMTSEHSNKAKNSSAKSILQCEPEDRLAGSLAATTWLVQQGVDIIRTHDVKETMDAIKVIHAIQLVGNS